MSLVGQRPKNEYIYTETEVVVGFPRKRQTTLFVAYRSAVCTNNKT